MNSDLTVGMKRNGSECEEIDEDEIKKLQIDLLKEFHRVCQDLKLRYTLCYGTAIGAMRHNGFIPWDDDIDVAMPREDYEVLCEKFDTVSSVPYIKLRDSRKDRKHIYPFAKIEDCRTSLCFSGEDRSSAGVFIDVFPLDGMPNNEFWANIHLRLLLFLRHCTELAALKVERRRALGKNALILIFKVFTLAISNKCWNRLMNHLASLYSYDESKWIGCAIWGYVCREKIPADFYNGVEQQTFEGEQFDVISGIDGYLRCLYGDWKVLPPVECRSTSHFKKAFWK